MTQRCTAGISNILAGKPTTCGLKALSTIYNIWHLFTPRYFCAVLRCFAGREKTDTTFRRVTYPAALVILSNLVWIDTNTWRAVQSVEGGGRYCRLVWLTFSVCLQVKDSLVQELQQKAEETELLHMELQMLETERVRLSLVEEKLVDILQLLQQLRDLVSHSFRVNSSI